MQAIITATLIVAIIGLVIGLLLVMVDKKFKVEVDPREAAVRDYLPGNNCGGCGYAGCDALAAAIVAGTAPVNKCPVGGAAVAEQIAQIMDVNADASVKQVAFVKCAGDCETAVQKCNYFGVQDCSAAIGSGLNPWKCDHGCLGFGSCVKVCPFDAIHVVNGVAKVDRSKCKACGKCVAACPKHLIELVPEAASFAVACSSKDRGPAVKNVCSAGCIGCTLCTKQCESDAITVENNIAHIDYEKCIGCGKCKEKCPTGAIINPRCK